ncbi:rhodanese-like domain-containing protein [Pseudohoeflea coraliihabitans]|uniref:Rhodanese-like domain-containing protein n=1 Tax=Pseudohoeflea coraliihabitans TaxID=2860393 RepID=A0ABS6WLD6_9HYPH|nr:rhodanese-like domain-containing protein [Pseudohoeflea sp. DP4N28-3]MBW3096772.1 rhodanese-like domain-containing protein [Pseudohoeflea sp. DP4N28-3]
MSDQSQSSDVESWTPQEVHNALQAGEIVLIDVRTPQEYMFEHIEGALLAPMSFLKATSLPGQSEKRIVFHCGSGMRSGKVAQKCLDAGFDKIAHMEGGFGAWKQAGLPYMATDPATGAPKRVDGSAS